MGLPKYSMRNYFLSCWQKLDSRGDHVKIKEQIVSNYWYDFSRNGGTSTWWLRKPPFDHWSDSNHHVSNRNFSFSGFVIPEKNRCTACSGKKIINESKLLEAFVEKGMRNGEKIYFKGEGDQVVSEIYSKDNNLVFLFLNSHEFCCFNRIVTSTVTSLLYFKNNHIPNSSATAVTCLWWSKSASLKPFADFHSSSRIWTGGTS